MRQKEKGLEKVQILIDPTNGQNFLESLEKKPHWSRNDHTSLADAIMTGNVENVKKQLCRVSKCKVTVSSKEECFGGCLVAVKYGQL